MSKPDTRAAVKLLLDLPIGSAVAVVGKMHSGKTLALHDAIRAGQFRRRVVFDPLARVDRDRWARGRRDKWPWEGRLVSTAELFTHPELLDADPLALVVYPDSRDDKRVGELFGAVVEMAMATQDIDVIAEEAGAYSRHATNALHRVITEGAHNGTRLAAVSQSFSRLAVDGRRTVTHVIAGPQSYAEDLRQLKALSPALAARVARLKQGDPLETWAQGEGFE